MTGNTWILLIFAIFTLPHFINLVHRKPLKTPESMLIVSGILFVGMILGFNFDWFYYTDSHLGVFLFGSIGVVIFFVVSFISYLLKLKK